MSALNDAKTIFLEFCERFSTGVESYAKTTKLSIEKQKCRNKIKVINERLGSELVKAVRAKTEINSILVEITVQEIENLENRIAEIEKEIDEVKRENI